MKSDVQHSIRAKESQRALIDAAAGMDAPVVANPALDALLARKPQWEKLLHRVHCLRYAGKHSFSSFADVDLMQRPHPAAPPTL